MPWVRAQLRGQTVFARADASGALKADQGRVEVRYKPNDGRKYIARADNLTVVDPAPLPDTTCAPAEAVSKPNADGEGSRVAHRKGASSAERPIGATPADAIIVYADGACSGNPGPAGIGVVMLDGAKRLELSEYLGEATNNIAELTAVLRALEEIEDPERAILLHTDSQYTIGVLQKGWKAKANVDLIQRLRGAMAKRTWVHLVYVRGHAGVPLNERADELAREAVTRRGNRRIK